MFGARWIPNVDVDRAELRTTLAYQFTPTISAGLEYNPLAEDLGPIANWLAIPETEETPALIFGTSSDRIGTPHGRAIYGTVSKDLEHLIGLPVAPYAGLAWGTFEDELEVIGGLGIRWGESWWSTHLWDGENFHNILETTIAERHTVGLILVEIDNEYSVGVTYSVGFTMPWED